MSVDPDPVSDSIRDFAGDAAGAAVLRDGLGQLARLRAGTPLGGRISGVLAGRVEMRDLAEDPELIAFARTHAQRFSEEWELLDAEGRHDLLGRGDHLTADLARRTTPPGAGPEP